LLFVLTLAGWTFYLTQADLPVFSNPEVSSMEKWKIWLGVPLLAACLALLAQWGWSSEPASKPGSKRKTMLSKLMSQPWQRKPP
jgi:hypothetical protein